MYIISFLEILFLFYFIYVVFYTAFFSSAAIFYKNNFKTASDKPIRKYVRFCLLIPAYKEDNVIIETVKMATAQTYPRAYCDIVVIADQLRPDTLMHLRKFPIRLIEVSFENSTKVKALNLALAQLPEVYDYAVVLDADNIMSPTFLEKLADRFATGNYHAIQGQRVAKNSQTTLAYLDGVSEAINNHIYRQGNSALGLSASISGSGIAVDYLLMKKLLYSMDSVGGFDRELELLLLREGVKVKYCKEAIVYDEKVSNSSSFQSQRTRWIASQYIYLSKYFLSGVVALLKGNFTYFNSAVLRNIQLPRLLNIGLMTALVIVLFFFRESLQFSYNWWPALFALNTIAIMIAIPKKYYSPRLLFSIITLPMLFIRMVSMLFKIKGSNKKFIHTPHGV